MNVSSEIRHLFESVDAMCGEIESETQTLVSDLERLSGALREVEEAREKIRCILEGDSDNTPDQLDAAVELESSALETLASDLSRCEMEVDDFLKILTRDIQYEFGAIKELLVNHR